MNERDEQQKSARERVQLLLEKTEKERLLKRLSHSASELCNGKVSILLNQEIFHNLQLFLQQIEVADDMSDISGLLASLATALESSDETLRERGLVVISMVLNEAMSATDSTTLRQAFLVLCEWLTNESCLLPGYEYVSKQMLETAQKLQAQKKYEEVERYIRSLHTLLKHTHIYANTIRAVAERSFKQFNSTENHAFLFSELMSVADSEKSKLEAVVLALGGEAMKHFVGRLSDDGLAIEQRELLIDFLLRNGSATVAAIDVSTDNQFSRKFALDTLHILRKVKVHVDSKVVEKYFQHHDIQVQLEAVKFLVDQDQSQSVYRLIEATKYIHNEVLIDVVRYLSSKGGGSTGACFRGIIKDIMGKKRKAESFLLTSLIVGLRNHPDPATVDTLLNLLNNQCLPQNLMLRRMLERTIQDIENTLFHRGHTVCSQDEVVMSDDPEAHNALRFSLAELNEEVDNLIEQGRRDIAVNKLVEKAEWFAAEKDFTSAEYLMDRLLDVDSNAVSAVFALEGRIEREKRSTVPASVYNLWKGLVAQIGKPAFTDMFNSIIVEQYGAGERLVKRGDHDKRLYFIYSGSVGIWSAAHSEETFIKKCKPGEILGAEVVFGVTYWTVTLRAEKDIKVFVLDWDNLRRLTTKYPEIAAKMSEFCHQFTSNEATLKTSIQDRRGTPRRQVSADVNVSLFDRFGRNRGKPVHCTLVNISDQGACYTIRLAKAENTVLMLGRTASIHLALPDGEMIELQGEIVGVHRDLSEEKKFRVSLRLDVPVSPDHLMAIIRHFG